MWINEGRLTLFEQRLRCVPPLTCRWCPGAGNTPVPTPAPAPAPVPGRPSRIPFCPASHVDCGVCLQLGSASFHARMSGSLDAFFPVGFIVESRCVPPTSCRWCPAASFLSLQAQRSSLNGDSRLKNAVVQRLEANLDVRPSSVAGCLADYVDCGTCLCVPRATCRFCYATEPNVTLPVPGRNFTARPSEVPYCPRRFVDCGDCNCVPLSTCHWCPDSTEQEPGEPNVTDPSEILQPSRIPGCPLNYVDCGTCTCVPRATCRWCPGVAAPPTPPTSPQTNVTMRPSVIPFCLATHVDCGSCLCVPEATCQWCPGAGTPQPLPPPPRRPKQPSQVTGCPAAFFDCGTCHCVPEHTCRWCPGWDEEPPLLTTTAPVTVSSTQAPPSSSLSLSTSGSPGFCPAGFTFCDDSGCVWGLSCSDYGYGWRSQETQDPASEGKVLRI